MNITTKEAFAEWIEWAKGPNKTNLHYTAMCECKAHKGNEWIRLTKDEVKAIVLASDIVDAPDHKRFFKAVNHLIYNTAK